MGDFFSEELGYPINIINDSVKMTGLYLTDAFEHMPTYPEKGYIQTIDGIVVIKLASGRE